MFAGIKSILINLFLSFYYACSLGVASTIVQYIQNRLIFPSFVYVYEHLLYRYIYVSMNAGEFASPFSACQISREQLKVCQAVRMDAMENPLRAVYPCNHIPYELYDIQGVKKLAL